MTALSRTLDLLVGQPCPMYPAGLTARATCASPVKVRVKVAACAFWGAAADQRKNAHVHARSIGGTRSGRTWCSALVSGLNPVEQCLVHPARVRLDQVRPVGRPLAPGLAGFNPAHPPHPSRAGPPRSSPPRPVPAILTRPCPHRQVFGQVSWCRQRSTCAISRKPLDGTCILTTRQRAECPVRGQSRQPGGRSNCRPYRLYARLPSAG